MDLICGLAVRVYAFVLSALTAWKTAFLARTFKAVMLFKTGVAIGPGTNLTNLVEADYSGYARKTVADLNGPALDQAGNGYLTTSSLFFQHDGGVVGNQIFTAGLVGTLAGGSAATGTAAQTDGVIDTVAVTAPGGTYAIPPYVTVNDDDGSGAIVTATINGDGEVDGLVIVDGGTGYTGPTLTIDPPVELLGGVNLDSPVPMLVSTDALPLAMQINLPSGA